MASDGPNVDIHWPNRRIWLVTDADEWFDDQIGDATSSNFASEDWLHGVHGRIEYGHHGVISGGFRKIDQQRGLGELDAMLRRGFVIIDQLTLVTDSFSVTKHFQPPSRLNDGDPDRGSFG